MKISRALILLIMLAAAVPYGESYAAGPTTAAETAHPNSPPGSAKALGHDDTVPTVPPLQFPEEQSKIDGWKATLDRIESALHNRYITDAVLSGLRDPAAETRTGALDLIAAVAPRLDAASKRAAQLAPDPKSTTAQSGAVKLERAKLLAEIAARQNIIQQAQLIEVRAQQVLDAISARRRAIFASSVLHRADSLINPSFWITVAANVPAASQRLADLFAEWGSMLAAQPLRAVAGLVIVVIVLIGFLLSPGRRWQAHWTTRGAHIENPARLRKTASAAAILLVNLAIPGVTLLVLYQSLIALGILPQNIAPIVRALVIGVTFAFFLAGLTTAVLAPGRPSWRLIPLDNAAADGMVPIAVAMGLVVALGIVLDATNRVIGAPVELSVASQGVVGIARALLFMGALRLFVRAVAEDDEAEAEAGKRSAWQFLIPIGWIGAIAALLAPLTGYVAFGRFVSGEMLIAVLVLMGFVLLSRLADALVTSSFAFNGRVGRLLRQTVGFRMGAIRQIAVLLSGTVHLALIAFGVFLVLATWGIHSDDVLGPMSSAFFGFKLGNVTISLSAIFGALIVLIVGIVATRMVQRWFDSRFLPETSLDLGVRSSIRTGVGYVGVILAAIVAFSYAGLSLQNVALVAGALSVGIGFGLQSIVNNFVSGLILLAERPIKVGDRIEVGTRMGVVQRINVRATEILTYDNVSVIVPNADLISGQVINWMHGSSSARLSVNVSTAYDTDPDNVIAMLLDIVAHHPRILKSPEPFAILNSFGADALEFSVYFHVGNIGLDGGVPNEVRLEILKRFRAEGIEVPSAHRDLRLRDIDRIEGLVRELNAGRKLAHATRGAAANQEQVLIDGSRLQAGAAGEA
ncbi:MAG TPA: DUF3772 domain-containing protein [Pseudolabrys sp.]|nr:DUF3772 domain-containing protein [Pseudolabrys sp.]